MATPAMPLSFVLVWSWAGSVPRPTPTVSPNDIMADPIAHSPESAQPWLLLANVSVKKMFDLNTQPVIVLQESVVQALLSLQTIGVWLTPVMGSQVSLVQALLSSIGIGVWIGPVMGSHESAVQTLLSLMLTGVWITPIMG